MRQNNRRVKAPPAGQKRFLVVAEVTISMHTEVIAATKKDAELEALERPMMSLCHQCASGEPEVEWTTSGEFDGEPMILGSETHEL